MIGIRSILRFRWSECLLTLICLSTGPYDEHSEVHSRRTVEHIGMKHEIPLLCVTKARPNTKDPNSNARTLQNRLSRGYLSVCQPFPKLHVCCRKKLTMLRSKQNEEAKPQRSKRLPCCTLFLLAQGAVKQNVCSAMSLHPEGELVNHCSIHELHAVPCPSTIIRAINRHSFLRGSCRYFQFHS